MNTLGAIVGTVLGGFVLMPLVGAQGALKIAVVVNLLLGLALVAGAGPRALRSCAGAGGGGCSRW